MKSKLAPRTRPYRLAYVVTHPIQYQAPLLRLIHEDPETDLTVFFLSDFSTQTHQDEEFGVDISWDTPLTEGFHSQVIKSVKTSHGISFFNPKVSVLNLLKRLRAQRWDAIWVHGYANLGLLTSILFARFTRTPLFFRGENNLLCSPQKPLKNMFIRWLVKGSQSLLYIGQANRQYYLHHGAKESQLHSVPYAVDNHFFQTAAKGAQPLDDLKLDHRILFLFASKLTPRKNGLLLLQAFAQIDSGLRSQARLVYVGDGEQRHQLEQEIQQQELTSQVEILGFKDQAAMAKYLAACSVFVLPSAKEPFGLVVNEAMNAAKPIITTDEVGSARDLVEHGVNGWIVSANDRDALQNAIETAIQQRGKLHQMGGESLRKINQWDFYADIAGVKKALNSLPIKR